MVQIRIVTPTLAVSPQITPQEVAAIKSAGYNLIINNRPDGESPDQASGAEIEIAARAEGLDYAHVPVVGRPTSDQAAVMRRLLATPDRRTLAFCRSGTRSITAWALGEQAEGTLGRDEILRLAVAAGYDLSGMLPA